MGSSKGTFWGGLGRVLALAERVLGRVAGEELDPAAFRENLAFRWESSPVAGRLVPIREPHRFELDDLIGVERSVERLVRNIEQFLRGLPSNHVLLFGERGTGKSSAVKGLLSRFGDRGLRMVEVHRDDLVQLPEIQRQLRSQPFRFLVFCDDLSFGEGESGHRELKAALEGTLEAPPQNVRVIATSNRRHLLPEHMRENREARLDESGELHLGEALEEKLALSDRFGLVLGFYSFNQATYLQIVEQYAKQAGLQIEPERLREESLRWALDRSSRSGRTARQFVDDLAGREALRKRSE